jgi:hypothetical protein
VRTIIAELLIHSTPARRVIMNYHYSGSKPVVRWRHDILLFTTTWLVPLFVWVAVMAMALAIAGLLLGEE